MAKGVNCVLMYNDKLISGGGDCKVKLWEPITGQSLVIMTGHSQEVVSHMIVTWLHINEYSCVYKLMRSW